MAHLSIIASEPHPAGSPAQERVRDYLMDQLERMGLEAEIQKTAGIENVVARLPGTNASGTIVILSHYDSVAASPGAGDNGSGVAALLETARTMSVRDPLPNEFIFLFDDGEELPDMFTGSKAFVREHRWMSNVKVAISLDTAVAGPISTDETGQGNGWLVHAMSRAYTSGAWTSISGGGGYDSTPFRQKGLMVLALESNFPFKEKHTALDRPEIVWPGTVQQMGTQVLAIARELGSIDLNQPRDRHEVFFAIPFLLLVHYPVTWSVPLLVAACVLMILMLILAFMKKRVTWRGLLRSLGVILASSAVSAALISLIIPFLPGLFGWQTSLWPDWPEIIPPGGIYVFAFFVGLVLTIVFVGYRLTRRWHSPTEISIAGLFAFFLFALVLSLTLVGGAYAFIWPVIIGSAVWIITFWLQMRWKWPNGLSLTLVSLPVVVLVLPLVPGIVMSDGMKSLAILAAILSMIFSVFLPAYDYNNPVKMKRAP